MLMQARRYPESLAQFQKVLERDADFNPAHYKLSQLYANTGHFADAVTELQKSYPAPGSWSADAQGYLQASLAGLPKQEFSAAQAVAFAIANDRERAFECLEKSYAGEDIELLLAIRYPAFDSIRSDPRFSDLMRRLGLPE